MVLDRSDPPYAEPVGPMAAERDDARLYLPKPDQPGRVSDVRPRSSALVRRSIFPVAGAVAGVASAIAFAAIHAVFISNIWYSIVPTAVVGAICGVFVAGSFGILVRNPTVRSWLLYNATLGGLFTLLGIASLVIYEPVTTISALMTVHGPPTWLFEQTVPLQISFTIAAAAFITPAFGHRWWHIGPVLVTATLLVLTLGLNISIFGLVDIPRSAAYVVAELVGLILTIVVVYALVFVALESAVRQATSENVRRIGGLGVQLVVRTQAPACVTTGPRWPGRRSRPVPAPPRPPAGPSPA
jgi:hypothetical protein